LQATEHLSAMNGLGQAPWELIFSFRPALQSPLLKMWKRDRMNVAGAQRAFHRRTWCNSNMRFGEYTEKVKDTKRLA